MKKDVNEVLELIMSKKLSLRSASKLYDYDRNFLKRELEKKYENNPDGLRELMSFYKNNSSTKSVEDNLLEKVIFGVLKGEITITQACEETKIDDRETLKLKFSEYILKKNNDELTKLYLSYSKKHNVDYSNINFRIVAISMIRNNLSQTDMAKQLGILPRTVSREFEKLKNDKDNSLYWLIKSYNECQMKHRKLSEAEKILFSKILDKYELENKELLDEKFKSKIQEKIERQEFLVKSEDELRSKGFTQKQIAEYLKTSVSSLRRARKNCENRNNGNEK